MASPDGSKGAPRGALIKWPGGKARELKRILPSLPPNISHYYDPFVGGGALLAAVEAQHYYINDKSHELIALYRAVQAADPDFLYYALHLNESWKQANTLNHAFDHLGELYGSYRSERINETQLRQRINDFLCEEVPLRYLLPPGQDMGSLMPRLTAELDYHLIRRMLRMNRIERDRGSLPLDNIAPNILTAIKGALYNTLRYRYNQQLARQETSPCAVAIFLFIRSFAYSGMFRYNHRGEFNVPYGGMAYNDLSLDSRLEYYQSPELHARLARTTIDQGDFLDFLHQRTPKPDDFLFLDPPYDSEFSTYARNPFTPDDHRRLASYLLHECPCRWMLVIKRSELIEQLYAAPELHITEYQQEYAVSFMGRNDRTAQHLMIRNY